MGFELCADSVCPGTCADNPVGCCNRGFGGLCTFAPNVAISSCPPSAVFTTRGECPSQCGAETLTTSAGNNLPVIGPLVEGVCCSQDGVVLATETNEVFAPGNVLSDPRIIPTFCSAPNRIISTAEAQATIDPSTGLKFNNADELCERCINILDPGACVLQLGVKLSLSWDVGISVVFSEGQVQLVPRLAFVSVIVKSVRMEDKNVPSIHHHAAAQPVAHLYLLF